MWNAHARCLTRAVCRGSTGPAARTFGYGRHVPPQTSGSSTRYLGLTLEGGVLGGRGGTIYSSRARLVSRATSGRAPASLTRAATRRHYAAEKKPEPVITELNIVYQPAVMVGKGTAPLAAGGGKPTVDSSMFQSMPAASSSSFGPLRFLAFCSMLALFVHYVLPRRYVKQILEGHTWGEMQPCEAMWGEVFRLLEQNGGKLPYEWADDVQSVVLDPQWRTLRLSTEGPGGFFLPFDMDYHFGFKRYLLHQDPVEQGPSRLMLVRLNAQKVEQDWVCRSVVVFLPSTGVVYEIETDIRGPPKLRSGDPPSRGPPRPPPRRTGHPGGPHRRRNVPLE